ncbi:FlgN protein [Carnobacterium iners]|uniref:FlgN protein n=1 Tax=Carnobacterium iners TaxID=1073423 RepID=A0A1X7MZX4_9LACT|nr:flagellar export chaperone FlgN [Carnobacterium iners]SEK21409.1 FlgN protein [Carnobacterium iners]SMH30534.1 FlgN protein [Carnobacterium iners]
MKKPTQVIEILKKFKTVLLAEKKALIKNDSAKVIAVIAEKETFMEVLPTLDAKELNKEDLSGIVEEIKQLQETNLLLTKQALQYQGKMMEAITDSAKTSGSTYSKNGQYSAEKQSSIIDQSL